MKKNKYCFKCKKEKEINQFNKNKAKKDGLSTYCKSCCNAYTNNRYATNLELRIRLKNKNLKYCHNLTPEEYINKLNSQNNNCAICGQPQSNFKRALAIDHDHTTKNVRGLLCNKCNRGLGLFDDDINRLLNAAFYLKSYKEMP